MSALYNDVDIGHFCLTADDDSCFRGGDFHARDTRGEHGMYGMTVGQDVQELESSRRQGSVLFRGEGSNIWVTSGRYCI